MEPLAKIVAHFGGAPKFLCQCCFSKCIDLGSNVLYGTDDEFPHYYMAIDIFVNAG